MEYLPQGNRAALGETVDGQILATGKDVIVIGGGDTGADCIGTALRQGARSVTSLEIMPRPGEERSPAQPMADLPDDLPRRERARRGRRARVCRVDNRDRRRRGRSGAGLRCTEVEFVDGRFSTVAGTEREIPAQLVLLAMGFLGPQAEGFVEQLGVELDERSNVVRDDTYMTSVPGVFVAG
jgi:glutamate synthase (NADPH/NADH) small chain